MDLIDVTLACEDANSKCVDVVTVANEFWSYVHMTTLDKVRINHFFSGLFTWWVLISESKMIVLRLDFVSKNNHFHMIGWNK